MATMGVASTQTAPETANPARPIHTRAAPTSRFARRGAVFCQGLGVRRHEGNADARSQDARHRQGRSQGDEGGVKPSADADLGRQEQLAHEPDRLDDDRRSE